MEDNKRMKAEKIFGQVNKSWNLMLSDMFLLYEEELKELDPYFYEVLKGWRYSNLTDIAKEEYELKQSEIKNILNKLSVGDKIKVAIYDCCEGIAIVKQIGENKKTMLIEFIDEPTPCHEKSHLESKEIHIALTDIYELKIFNDKPRYYVENYCCLTNNFTNIGIASPEDEKRDGESWVSTNESYSFNLYSALEDAIKNADYIADKIQFVDLTKDDMKLANDIVNKLMSDETYLKKFGRTLN